MATWAMKQRYGWINERLAAGESFTRADIVTAFTVTKQTASATMREFEALHPDVVRYDASRKAFVRADTPAAPKGLNPRERGLLTASTELLEALKPFAATPIPPDAKPHHAVNYNPVSATFADVLRARAAIAKVTGVLA